MSQSSDLEIMKFSVHICSESVSYLQSLSGDWWSLIFESQKIYCTCIYYFC